MTSNAELLTSAWRAYAAGDVERLAGLVEPDAVWIGRSRGHRERVYACRDGDEVRDRLREIRSTPGWNLTGDEPSDAIAVGPGKVILRLRWQEDAGATELHQLYVLRERRIVAIADYWSRDDALAVAGASDSA
jgi:ketosteroid isomerase-like protein